MTALAFQSPAVRGLQGNTLTLTAEEFEQLKKLTVCPLFESLHPSLKRGWTAEEMCGRQACPSCGGSGFSVSKRPIIGAAPAVPCPMMHPHWQPCLSEPARVLWVADEIERVMATDDPELGAAVWLRGVRRLAKPLTEWIERPGSGSYFSVASLPEGFSEAPVGLVEAVKEAR